MENNNYASAVGRIRALENQMLKLTDFERLLELDNAKEVVEELDDTPYGEYFSQIKDINEFEIFLTEELRKTYKLIRELSLHPEITDLFFLRKDLHNLKVTLKNKYGDTANEEYLVDLGLLRLSELKEMVAKNDYTKFPNPMIARVINQAIGQYELTGEKTLIDFVLDGGLYEISLDTAKKYKNNFLEILFRLEIDTINLKTLVRFIVTKRDKRYFKDVLIHGGYLPYEFFLREIGDNEKNLAQQIKKERYGGLISPQRNTNDREKSISFLKNYEKLINLGITNWEKERSFSYLEKLADDFLIEHLKKAKYISLGIEPLIGYLLAKEIEVKNIRMIIVAKIAELSSETVRKNLRETYV